MKDGPLDHVDSYSHVRDPPHQDRRRLQQQERQRRRRRRAAYRRARQQRATNSKKYQYNHDLNVKTLADSANMGAAVTMRACACTVDGQRVHIDVCVASSSRVLSECAVDAMLVGLHQAALAHHAAINAEASEVTLL